MDHGAGGAMPGMMSGEQMHQLGQASSEGFDHMFLQTMITHHHGAVTMAEIELRDGESPRLANSRSASLMTNSGRSPKCRIFSAGSASGST
jgi:uncharacterized protein (DUF305 family)